MTEDIIGPTSHYFYSQRLKLHYVDWGNPAGPLALLIHGSRDHCRNWDWVALDLRRHFHVIAPDLRGHGDSDWAIGGSYAMVDYVLDIAQLMNAVGETPAAIIGHSLGAGVALQYAGVYPGRICAVVAIEGLGPPASMVLDAAPDQRMRTWIGEMQALARRQVRRYGSIEEALSRMREVNPRLSLEQARHLTIHGVRRNEDGAYSWKFDNYTRATSPYLFNLDEAAQIWERITAPCLLVHGDESWAMEWEKEGRQDHFHNATLAKIGHAGHWVHHDRLGEFLKATYAFLRV